MAVFCGSVAIILAILQIFLGSLTLEIDIEYVKWFELISFSIAIIAVGIALWSRQHKEWLKKRYLAEQCRSLKFRALIHPFLWCSSDRSWDDRFAKWRERFNAKAENLKKMDEILFEVCLESDEITPSPSNTRSNSFDNNQIRELIDYYKNKRILTQIRYFNSRAEYFDSVNWTRWIPDLCFKGSIIFVAGHFGIDFFLTTHDPGLKFVSSVFLMVTLILPIFAIGVRTLRSSIEVSRSASLFNAKSRALQDFELRLDKEMGKVSIRCEDIIKILWECENFFENENREWLRIMSEAEWFL